jgi:hypothetical protein
MRALQSGGNEKLEFSIGGQQSPAVALEPGLPEEAIVRRMNNALAPTGIRVAQDGRGSLLFSAPEPAWPALQDQFAVKGGGSRFPAGQFNRVQADAEPEAIRPEGWRSGDAAALRKTLKEVVDAQDLIRQVRAIVRRSMADADKNIAPADTPDERERMFSFARGFEQIAAQPAYQVISAVAPALVAISRGRVTALLSGGE